MVAPIIGIGLRLLFGIASRPVLTTGAAVVADQTLNDGDGTDAALTSAFGYVKDRIAPDLDAPNSWLTIGGGLLAALSVFNGDYGNALMIGLATIFMDDILRFIDETLERNGIDIIPDEWYTEPVPIKVPTEPTPG